MTQKRKGDKFLLYIPKGKEKEFELYKRVLKELGFTTSERIFSMIDSDMETVITVVESIMKMKGEKKE